jgi:hypothetical protein
MATPAMVGMALVEVMATKAMATDMDTDMFMGLVMEDFISYAEINLNYNLVNEKINVYYK